MNVHPVLLTLGAALILREALGPRRLFGILAALIGALVIIQPGTEVFTPAALLPLGAGIFYASYGLATRFLGRDEPVPTSFLYTALIGTIIASLLAIPLWQRPGPGDAALFRALGATGALGHFLLIRALSVAEVGLVVPFGHAGVIFASLNGLLFFGEVPDGWAAAGALVIVGAGVYVWHRETRARAVAARSPPA
ncbi:MAG: DMT family transporter [Roseicyclus sp.]